MSMFKTIRQRNDITKFKFKTFRIKHDVKDVRHLNLTDGFKCSLIKPSETDGQWLKCSLIINYSNEDTLYENNMNHF